MTLTDFLLARISDDEAGARVAKHLASGRWMTRQIAPWGSVVEGSSPLGNPRAHAEDPELWDHEGALGMFDEVAAHVARFDPARVLAECEAKRRIVEQCQMLIDSFGDWDATPGSQPIWEGVSRRERSQAHGRLRTFAAVYADHPDYRDEWKS